MPTSLESREQSADFYNSRLKPMATKNILPWLVQFAHSNIQELAAGPPGDIPNLIYKLRTWLDLGPDEPLNADVRKLERNLVS